jgi:hypothetical protein
MGARCIHEREVHGGRDGRGRHFWPRHFLPPCSAAYTHNHIYNEHNSKHALTINQPDNQLLKCYNIWGQSSCATAMQAASKTGLHACNPCSPKIEPLRVQTNRICHFPRFASVHCTTLHNFFCPLAFLLNRREQFPVKQFTLFL